MEYFTVEFFEEVVQATNQASLLKDGRSFNLTKEDFFKFLALEVMIGTIGYPRLSMYWTAPTDIPAFRQNMTKNRFHSLRNNLKFPTSDPGNDKLFRIRPLINIFTKKLYTIPKEENLYVDEMMVPFKRKTVLRQYMPKKPIKWGIKLFCLCSSSGMLYDFEIYQGKNTVISGPKLGFCSDIVVHLTRTIPENKNLKLFFDNYFSTLNLILYLQKKGIWATGTIRRNRCSKVPLQSEKELKKEGRGSFDYRIEREDNLYVIRWLDGGVVQLISSIYGEEPLKNVQRFLVEKKTKVEITQPYIVAVYNKNMGGVDKIDFLLSLYRISIRSRKWTLKIFDHFIDLAICNSWLEYRKDHEGNNKGQMQKHMDLLEFRNDIADGLLAQANKDAFLSLSLSENIDSPSTS